MLKAFNERRDEIIKKFGTSPMYEDQIQKYCQENIPYFGGVFTHDKLIPEDNKSYIVNTGNFESPGYHWIAIVVTRFNMYVFDSFHRNIHKIVRNIDKLKGDRHVVVSKWSQPVQDDSDPSQQNICGQLSIAWLECANHYGIRNAILI